MTITTAGATLRALLSPSAEATGIQRPLPFIGIYDLFSARLVARRFDGLFVSGFGLAASTYGLPDVGFMAWSDLLTVVHRLRHALPHHHLLVDLDDGFGDGPMAAHVAAAMERAGASGIVLEDQRRPRRCGHLDGKEILPLEEYRAKLRAVLAARSDLVVVARTDASEPEEVLRRVRAFEAEGCDAVLADGLDNLELLAEIRRAVRCPVVANVIGGGRTPDCDRASLGALGLDVLIYSTPCLFAAQRAIEEQLASLAEEQMPFSQCLSHGVVLPVCQEVLNPSPQQITTPAHPPNPSRLGRLRSLAARGSQEVPAAAACRAIPVATALDGVWPEGCRAYPAAFAQARLWFQHQLQPGLTAYNMTGLWRLQGRLDLPALEAALLALIERHPTLRTSFRMVGSELVQILHPPPATLLSPEPLGDRDGQAVAEAWLAQEQVTPFDLTTGLLLRARLLRVDTEEHLLLINHHHIASDGWSLSVLKRDLAALYNALRRGQPAALPPLPVLYHDYAVWQRQQLTAPRLQELRHYWIPALEGLEPLELPSDRSRSGVPSYRGSKVPLHVEAALLEPFEELCRSQGATLHMGLLAVVALLLQRYSRQDDFAIGVPFWSRGKPELEELIGFFINTLPIRVHFEPGQSFRELLAQVRATSIDAYGYQELPYEQIVEALRPERDVGRNPFYQVMLQLQELPERSLAGFDGLTMESLSTPREGSHFDLSFTLWRQGNGGLSGSVTYAADLFQRQRIERLVSHLQTLLVAVVHSPDLPAERCSLLPSPEAEQIRRWSAPGSELPPEPALQSRGGGWLIAQIEAVAQRDPGQPALLEGDRELSYGALLALTRPLAERIEALGPGPGGLVVLAAQSRLEIIVAMVACQAAAQAFVVLDLSLPRSRQLAILDELGGAPIVASDHARPMLASLGCEHQNQLYFRLGEQPDCGLAMDVLIAADRGTPSRTAGHNLAYAVFTSGSTGKPKGVIVGLEAFHAFVDWAVAAFAITPSDRILQFSSLAFDACIEEIFPALVAGATICCRREADIGSPQDFLRKLEECAVSVVSLPTAFWAELLDQGIHAGLTFPDTLRLVIVGGETMTPQHWRQWQKLATHSIRLLNTYGPTEATVEVLWHELIDGLTCDQPVPIGRPVPYAQVWVLDPSGQPCPIGIPGELHIGGAGLARGYLNQPELTAEKFIPDPFASDPGARLYKSGDLASWNGDGTLAFHGRIDDQIKLRGFRIEPGEIEANLLAHPGVSQAVVVLRKDDSANSLLVGYWVPDGGGRATAQELRGFLAERLPEFMVPAALVELDVLPLTSNGKLDRGGLPAPSFSGAGDRRLPPGTELERQLHGIWAEVLGHGEFGITDSFFAVGGHSLLTMRLKTLVDGLAGDDVPLACYFSCPTIALFAEHLQQGLQPQHQNNRAESTVQPPTPPQTVRLNTALEPPPIAAFVEQQLAMLSHWPGVLAPGHQFVRTIAERPGLPGLFWCFQGANEYDSLAAALGPAVRVHGLRSAHGLQGGLSIYLNPALLQQVAGLYAREILELQSPNEPYVIGGNCQAGLIANAIAWHLIAHGRSVRTLILMEPSMRLIRTRSLRWREGALILYGTESNLNPFRAAADELAHRALRRAFGRKGYAVEFIPGLHGAFFESSNIPGLARVVRAVVQG